MKNIFTNKNMSMDWLMRNNRAFVYFLLKCSRKNDNIDKFFDYACIYHDFKLIDLIIKKNNKNNKLIYNNQRDNSLLYKAINSNINFNKHFKNNMIKKNYINIYDYEIYDLKYNTNFIKYLFSQGLVNKQQNNLNILKLIVQSFSEASALKRWDISYENNLSETNNLLKVLSDNNFKISNKEILENFYEISSKFKNIKQIEVFYYWLENDLLSYVDENGNNFLHYLVIYFDTLSDTLISAYENQSDNDVKNLGLNMIFSAYDYVSSASISGHDLLRCSNLGSNIICSDLYNFLNKLSLKLKSSPNYSLAINLRNKKGLTPLDIGNKKLSKYFKSKIMVNNLKSMLKVKEKKAKSLKI